MPESSSTSTILPLRLVPSLYNSRRTDTKLRLLRICNITSPRRRLLLLCTIFFIFIIGLLQPKYNALDHFYSLMDIESEIDAPSWSLQLQQEQEQDRHSLYTPSMFISENLEQNHYIPITAVIDRVTKDEQAVYHSVQHLLKYPFIKEIYINNNKFSRRPLSMEVNNDNSNNPFLLYKQ